jgi:hypothetical protein
MKNNKTGYVVLHGDISMLDEETAPEVVIASNGRPFKTYMEALVYGRVSCSGEWHVLEVKLAS